MGEALTCLGELLFDQAAGAFLPPLGPGRGIGSLVGLGHRLLSRRDDPAAALPLGPVRAEASAVTVAAGRAGTAAALFAARVRALPGTTAAAPAPAAPPGPSRPGVPPAPGLLPAAAQRPAGRPA